MKEEEFIMFDLAFVDGTPKYHTKILKQFIRKVKSDAHLLVVAKPPLTMGSWFNNKDLLCKHRISRSMLQLLIIVYWKNIKTRYWTHERTGIYETEQ